MAVQIQLRRGTAAAWTSANPTLAEGEIGYETDTGNSKIGNGVDDWTTLPYRGNVSAISAGGNSQGSGKMHVNTGTRQLSIAGFSSATMMQKKM